jgi:hypothetical protein
MLEPMRDASGAFPRELILTYFRAKKRDGNGRLVGSFLSRPA